MKYLIDTSSLLNLRDYYPPEVFPSLWDIIYKMFDEGTMFSVKEVYNELKDFKEPLKKYEDCFKELPESALKYLEYIISDDKFKVFQEQGLKKSNLENWADPYLIAYAMTDENITILTEESLTSHAKRKIPYVCNEVGVDCINFIDLLKHLNIKF